MCGSIQSPHPGQSLYNPIDDEHEGNHINYFSPLIRGKASTTRMMQLHRKNAVNFSPFIRGKASTTRLMMNTKAIILTISVPSSGQSLYNRNSFKGVNTYFLEFQSPQSGLFLYNAFGLTPSGHKEYKPAQANHAVCSHDRDLLIAPIKKAGGAT